MIRPPGENMPGMPGVFSGSSSAMPTADSIPRVVVIGGGFAGLALCRELAKTRCQVTLVDRRNYHLFQPLLYQVATAGLSGSDIAQPIRRILRRQRNAATHLGEVARIDLARRVVVVRDVLEPAEPGARASTDARAAIAREVELPYDFLAIACGVETNWFGHDAWAEHAIGLKTLADADRIRDSVLRALEQAENEPDGSPRRAALLTTVVIGGGPTGVEMAGALAELARNVSAHDFRRCRGAGYRVLLLDRDDRLLTSFDPALAQRAREDLERLGVEVRFGAAVESIERGAVVVAGARIEAATIVWAAGVQAPALTRRIEPPVTTDRAGRIAVDAQLRVPGHPEVFALGDIAHMDDGTGRGHAVPGVAQGAMQSGRYAGRAIRRMIEAGGASAAGTGVTAADAGTTRASDARPFRYADKGSLATIGKRRAVADLGGWRFAGTPAWLLWLCIHLLSLIDIRSKLTVLIKWAWAYLWYDPAGRILVERER
ncbi:MAG: NAD(P)/FAD-dependent oxidoreductase [Phycisphaerales bacterium]